MSNNFTVFDANATPKTIPSLSKEATAGELVFKLALNKLLLIEFQKVNLPDNWLLLNPIISLYYPMNKTKNIHPQETLIMNEH